MRPVRIANCSGFYGDRLSAAREMVDGGPIDVLTGDWLAELTMLLLAKQRAKSGTGYATTFLRQAAEVMADCKERGIRIVSNAGGLDPRGAAEALRAKAAELGVDVVIASVSGDDLMPRLGELRKRGALHGLPADGVLTANAYVGARGVAAALERGADIVVTGRSTDAAVVMGPAAWWHGWNFDAALAGDQTQLDALAGALVAGHVIECGAQATGGNYSFFQDVPGIEHLGFPIAEIASDGRTVITKHESHGGLVSIGTVTSQLMYEIADARYLNPDVTARLDTVQLDLVGANRVRISGTRGELPPPQLKVSGNTLGGFRNTMTLVLTGLEIEAKADVALRTITGLTLEQCQSGVPGELGPASQLHVRELHVELVRSERPDPGTVGDAQATLRLTVKDDDPEAAGKRFTAHVVESALASYPGMFPTAPPAAATPIAVFTPGLVDAREVELVVDVDGSEVRVPAGGSPDGSAEPLWLGASGEAPWSSEPTVRVPLGTVLAARSGDKGGDANVGFWIPDATEHMAVELARAQVGQEPDWTLDTEARWSSDEVVRCDNLLDTGLAFRWLGQELTRNALCELLPESSVDQISTCFLGNLTGVNAVFHGLLGRGVADSVRLDPQAKGLAEQLRARVRDVPIGFVEAKPG